MVIVVIVACIDLLLQGYSCSNRSTTAHFAASIVFLASRCTVHLGRTMAGSAARYRSVFWSFSLLCPPEAFSLAAWHVTTVTSCLSSSRREFIGVTVGS